MKEIFEQGFFFDREKDVYEIVTFTEEYVVFRRKSQFRYGEWCYDAKAINVFAMMIETGIYQKEA